LCIEPKIWTYKVVILSRSYTAFFVLHSARVIDKTILLSTRRRHELLQIRHPLTQLYWLLYSCLHWKPFYCTRVLLIRSRLIMTKTFVHWTEDMIQSRHRLATRAVIRHSSYCTSLVLILTKPFYWVLVLFTNTFIEYSCYLQIHLLSTRVIYKTIYWVLVLFTKPFIEYSCYLWTTAELTVDNRLSLAISMLAMHYIDTSSICHHLSVCDIHGRTSWQCSYWLKISRCKKKHQLGTILNGGGYVWWFANAFLWAFFILLKLANKIRSACLNHFARDCSYVWC
jgi:hypothetical protein